MKLRLALLLITSPAAGETGRARVRGTESQTIAFRLCAG